MAISFTGKKRIRKSFGRVPEVAPMPNLIEVQKSSYDHFLQMGVAPEAARQCRARRKCLRSVFPIRDFSERAQLEFVRYELETPKYDVEECQQRGITFAAPLKVTLRLVVWDVDEDTGSRSIRDIKEQDVYMGDMPLMTKQRHLHHQRHRTGHRLADAPQPGRVLRPRQGQDAFLGQIPVRRAGHPLSRLVARFRVRRQGPRLCPHRPAPQTAGDDAADGARRCRHRGEAGRSARPRASRCSRAKRSACRRRRSSPAFYGTIVFRRGPHGWMTPFDPEQFKGKLTSRSARRRAPARSGWPTGERMTPRMARRLREAGLSDILVARRGADRPLFRRGPDQRGDRRSLFRGRRRDHRRGACPA